MLSSSRITELLRYRKSRLPVGIYFPLALFLCTASLAAAWPTTVVDFANNILLAFTLVSQFRLWDDLSDVGRDRLDHAERVLTQVKSLAHFRVALAVLLAFNVFVIASLKPDSRFIAFLLLNTTFFVWYRFFRRARFGAIFNYHVVLIKYPVFVLLLSPASTASHPAALLYAVGLVYLCFCVHEVLHDAKLRTSRGAIYVLAIEMAALALLPTLMFFDLNDLAGPAALPQGALAILGSFVLVRLFQRHRSHVAPGRWCYAVFVIGFSWLLSYFIVAAKTASGLEGLAR